MPSSVSHLTSDALEQQASELAQILRQRRKVLGVSVQSAAKAAGMSRDTWYRMERGELTVTLAAWFNALAVLGLRFSIGLDAAGTTHGVAESLPLHISLADYPQLAALSWQMDKATVLTPREAFNTYERNARHIDYSTITPDERALIENLRRVFS